MGYRLHLGCGKRNFGGSWIHIDGSDYDHIHSHDIIDLPFEDESVELIYASHVLEYFDRDEVKYVLKKWYEKLQPGGTLRLAVPDFNAMANLYVNGGHLDNFIGPLYGKMKMGDTTIYHKTVYDMESITKILHDAGFKNVRRYDWRETEHAHIDDHSQAYLPHMDKDNGVLISLNVECNK
jgi:predicted SAM-dependent methyltransferase